MAALAILIDRARLSSITGRCGHHPGRPQSALRALSCNPRTIKVGARTQRACIEPPTLSMGTGRMCTGYSRNRRANNSRARVVTCACVVTPNRVPHLVSRGDTDVGAAHGGMMRHTIASARNLSTLESHEDVLGISSNRSNF